LYPGPVVVVNPSGVTQPLPSDAMVYVLSLSPGQWGSLVVALPSGLPPGAAVQVDIGPLTARAPYLVRAALNNPSLGQEDVVGPVAGPATGALFPLPPALRALEVPSVTLPASGGQTLTLRGEGLGVDALDEVVVTLTNNRGNAFPTARCTVVMPGTVCVCTSPVGVGVGLVAIVTVNGVSSDVFSPPRLAFTPPSIAALEGPGAQGRVFSEPSKDTLLCFHLLLYPCHCATHTCALAPSIRPLPPPLATLLFRVPMSKCVCVLVLHLHHAVPVDGFHACWCAIDAMYRCLCHLFLCLLALPVDPAGLAQPL
jgi:hypothetical protein